MLNPSASLLFTSSFETGKYSNRTSTNILVASLSRSLFSGFIHVIRNHERTLFRVERRQVEEVLVSVTCGKKSGADAQSELGKFFFEVGQLKPEPRQWVIIADAAGLAVRNIDHLIPTDSKSAHAPAEIDLHWTQVVDLNEGRRKVSASPGLWAVRGEYLLMVLEKWKSTWSILAKDAEPDEVTVWSEVVRELPLRKRPFEKGEVYAPEIGSVDWEAVSHAAFVTVPGWPQGEQRKFLQALYFGTYFGDESGLILNILDP